MKTEPKAITSQNTEIVWILIHIYRAKRKCKWYKLYLMYMYINIIAVAALLIKLNANFCFYSNVKMSSLLE